MQPSGSELRNRVRENLSRVQTNLAFAAPDRPVTLVCVTKYARIEWAQWLLEAGATNLGENLLPQAIERFDQLAASGRPFARHLIGAQQSRKLRLIPGRFDWFQALDRLDAADRLAELCESSGTGLNVLLQVNVSNEPQKHGFESDDVLAAVEHLQSQCTNLTLRGLMAIPPGPPAFGSPVEFERVTRSNFEQLRSLFDRIGAVENRSAGWDTLSMGMSQDYLWAVSAGATMVRIGSALFEGMEG